MEVAAIIRRELDNRGIKGLKEAARFLGVSKEFARYVLNEGKVPRDRTLVKIARALGLEPAVLILSGHRQQLPAELREEMLPVAPPAGGDWTQKRKWPLSQEQCDYLATVMRPQEIQFIRKCRQLTQEEKIQLAGYVDFIFSTCRVSPPPEHVPVVADGAVQGAEEGQAEARQ